MKTILIALAFLAGASAEVIDTSPAGFLVKNTATVTGKPEQVYRAIVNVGNWWEDSHTWSGSARNMSINAKAGGCFCERIPPDGEVQHMTVINAQPGKLLRMTGGLGPLQEAAVTGTLTYELKAAGEGTEVTMTYSAGGYYPGGLQALAEPVDRVLRTQLLALRAHLGR